MPMNPHDLQLLLSLYPALSQFSAAIADDAGVIGPFDAERGAELFREGAACAGFPLVLGGEIKVVNISADGRSIELYRVGPGDICLVSSASLFRNEPLAARGICAASTRLVLVAPDVFFLWLGQSEFRNQVLGLFAARMSDLTALVSAVVFSRLDARLAAALLGHGRDIFATHQQLADDLGSVREMVTRLLKRFAREGWVELSREHIRVVDSAALRQLASGLH